MSGVLSAMPGSTREDTAAKTAGNGPRALARGPADRSQARPGRWLRGSSAGLAILLFMGLGSGCRVSPGFEVTTRPPDFDYVPPARIQSSMWVLAAEVHHLDNLLRGPIDAGDPQLKREVYLSLERMTVAAKELDTPGRSTPGHPVLSQHLEDFLLRLDRAKRAIDRTPPDYFQASALAGGCFLCHGTHQVGVRDPAPSSSVVRPRDDSLGLR